METTIILRGKEAYKCLFEGKRYLFKRGEPVAMHPTLAAVIGHRLGDDGKLLFEIVHGETPKTVEVVPDRSPEAIAMDQIIRKKQKAKKTPGTTKRFGRQKKKPIED